MSKSGNRDGEIGSRLKLRDLRVVFVVAQSGSFAQAAARLRVSQPAVSQIVSNLESVLGVKLFDRNRRGVEPTPYGRVLLLRGQAAFDELQQGVAEIRSLQDPGAGEIRIGSTTATTDTILPHIVRTFMGRYPRVVLHIEDAPRIALDLSALRDRKFDLILGRIPEPTQEAPDAADIAFKILFRDQLVIAAGAHHALARKRKVDLRDLANESWILTDANSWNRSHLISAFKKAGLKPPDPTLVTFSITVRTHLLATGPYVTSFGRAAVLLNPNRQYLKILPIKLAADPWPYALVTLKDRTRTAAVERFIETAREVARSLIGDHAKDEVPSLINSSGRRTLR
jgi:DNA-binding transcriptional LysR family regulator